MTKARNSENKSGSAQPLKKYIDEANLIPAHVKLPDWKSLFQQELTESTTNADFEESRQRAIERTYEECLKDFPEDIKTDWLGQSIEKLKKLLNEPSELDLSSAMYDVLATAYDEMGKRRNDLRRLAVFFRAKRAKEPFYWLLFPEINTRLGYVDTTITVELSDFAKALDGVDGDRIRICEICDKLFWALRKGRRESRACSHECTDTLRHRKYRGELKEKLLTERQANYRYKKARSAKKNGAI